MQQWRDRPGHAAPEAGVGIDAAAVRRDEGAQILSGL